MGEPAPAAAPATRSAALEGLRALAVLAVVGRHLNQLGAVRGGGALGVGMFFALAGLLGAASLERERLAHGTVDLRRFVLRRVGRILPVLVAVVATLALYDLRAPGFLDLREAVAALTFTANHAMIAGPPIGPVTHTWFLATLVQLTVAWAVLSLALGRLRVPWALGAVLSLAVASWAWRAHLLADRVGFERMHVAPDTRADAFLLGVAAGLLLVHRPPRVPGWLVAVAGAVLAWELAVPPASVVTIRFGWTVVPLATAILALAAMTGDAWWTRVLSTRPLVALGAISYSLYLWHFPLYRVLDHELGITGAWRPVVLVGASVLVGAASHRWLEEPVGRALARWRSPSAGSTAATPR